MGGFRMKEMTSKVVKQRLTGVAWSIEDIVAGVPGKGDPTVPTVGCGDGVGDATVGLGLASCRARTAT